MAECVYDYFRLPETKVLIEEIKTLGLNTQAEKKSKSETNALFEGKTFVITGTLKITSVQRQPLLLSSLAEKLLQAFLKNRLCTCW